MAELKEYLYNEPGKERSAREILAEFEYNPEQLGARRIEGLAARVRRDASNGCV